MPYNPGREAVAAPRSGVVTAGSNPVTRTNVGVHSARLENGNRKCGCHFLICAPWLLLSESNTALGFDSVFGCGEVRYEHSHHKGTLIMI